MRITTISIMDINELFEVYVDAWRISDQGWTDMLCRNKTTYGNDRKDLAPNLTVSSKPV